MSPCEAPRSPLLPTSHHAPFFFLPKILHSFTKMVHVTWPDSKAYSADADRKYQYGQYWGRIIDIQQIHNTNLA